MEARESTSCIASLDLSGYQNQALRSLHSKFLHHSYPYCSLMSMDNLIDASRIHVDSGMDVPAGSQNPGSSSTDDDVSLSGPSRSGDGTVLQSGFVDELMAHFYAVSWEHAEECRTLEEAEGIARRVLKVYRMLPPDREAQNECHIEMLMKMLMLCCRFEVTDSRLVCDLLDAGLDLSPDVAPRDCRDWFDDLEYLQYLLEHCWRAGRDPPKGCWSNFESDARPFQNMFSVSRAVAMGDKRRTLLLLRHGLRVEDVQELNEGTALGSFLRPPDFHLDSKCLPYLVLLRQMTMFDFFLHITRTLPETKYEDNNICLLLLWCTLPDAYVNFRALAAPLRLLSVFEDSVFKDTLDWATHFMAYVDQFFELAVCDSRPRSLTHLCRCAIRRRLAENRQLPGGILQLRLPEELLKYVDLFAI